MSDKLSAVSYQLSAISFELSAISYQLSAISYQLFSALDESTCHAFLICSTVRRKDFVSRQWSNIWNNSVQKI